MAQQNKNSSQPQGFAGFDDLISEFSEDMPVPPQPKAQPAKPVSIIPSPPPPPKPVTPAPTPPRNDPPKPLPPPHQAPVKPETRVIVEPKPVPSSLPKAGEQISQDVLWFYVACGALFLIWLVSGTEKNQMSSRTSSDTTTQYRQTVVPSTATTNSKPTYEPITPSIKETSKTTYSPPAIQESRPAPPSKPFNLKVEPDPLVKEIQSKLLSLGYSPGSPDGYVGQKTLNAIRQFQKENKLLIDPKINEELLASLDHAQPRIVPQRRQELPSSRSVKNEEKDDVCPVGKICVRKLKESFSSSSDDIQMSTQKPVYSSNPDTSPPQKPASLPSKHRNTKMVCPTAIFCYPQPY